MAESRLVKGLYGHQSESKSRLFGITCGQIRGKDFIHNGGWYNKSGEKLGWGDLSPDDFRRIHGELEDGETFVVLYESDSFWNFVTRPGIIGSMAAVKPDVEAPGVDYVAEKCCYIITRERMYFVDRFGHDKREEFSHEGLLFKVIPRAEATAMLKAA